MTMEWLFGYGSLIWRPSFPFLKARPARLRGWRRSFWQGSTDHRGVPGAPGRVVTLVRAEQHSCMGMAYAIDRNRRAEILDTLDHREKGGYSRRVVELELDDGTLAVALAYIAAPDNPNYLGPAPLDAVAEQVRSAHGPSGSNIEYVLNLAEALRGFADPAEDLFELERRLLE